MISLTLACAVSVHVKRVTVHHPAPLSAEIENSIVLWGKQYGIISQTCLKELLSVGSTSHFARRVVEWFLNTLWLWKEWHHGFSFSYIIIPLSTFVLYCWNGYFSTNFSSNPHVLIQTGQFLLLNYLTWNIFLFHSVLFFSRQKAVRYKKRLVLLYLSIWYDVCLSVHAKRLPARFLFYPLHCSAVCSSTVVISACLLFWHF